MPATVRARLKSWAGSARRPWGAWSIAMASRRPLCPSRWVLIPVRDHPPGEEPARRLLSGC
jgi:hypothetical protein